METLAAVGLAGSIIQFVDFASRLVRHSTEIARSGNGTLVEYADIERASNDLVLLNARLHDKDGAVGAEVDEDLCKICESCDRIAKDLLSSLNKVKGKGTKHRWQSISVALRSSLAKSEIKDLEQRLSQLRHQLNLRLTVNLR